MPPITVDCHVHITSPEIIKSVEYYRQLDPYFNLLSSSPNNKFATGAEVIAVMNNSGIDRAVVFGFAFRDMALCREVNDYIMDVIALYPGRLLGLACVNPLADDLETELARCQAGGLVGVGELFPEGQGFDLTRRRDVGKLSGLCSEMQWPLLLHVNEPVGHYYPGKTRTTPAQAYIFAEQNPQLKIIMAHWGGGLWVYELMPEVKQALKNVYYDTAASPFLYRPEIYLAAKAAGIIDKILLGSDYPLISPHRYFDRLAAVALTETDKAKIRGENAIRLFKIEQ